MLAMITSAWLRHDGDIWDIVGQDPVAGQYLGIAMSSKSQDPWRKYADCLQCCVTTVF
jgi:hypothetical protein